MIILLGLFVASLFFSVNFTLLFAAIFLVIGIVDKDEGGKYLGINILSVFRKQKSGVSGVNTFAVTLDTKIMDIARRCKRNNNRLIRSFKR